MFFFVAVLEDIPVPPTTYIEYDGDYDALNANKFLEITKAIIYNYLISIGLPLTSNIIIYKGKKDFLLE